MKLLQELFRSPSEVPNDDSDAKSVMTFEAKFSFTHDAKLGQLMKERFSSSEFMSKFEESLYHALSQSYRSVQSRESMYSGDDWIDDVVVEAKLKKFSSGAFEGVNTTNVDMLQEAADLYNSTVDMIRLISEDNNQKEIEEVERQIAAALAGLGLANKLKRFENARNVRKGIERDPRFKHVQRVMTNLNKLRAKLVALKKADKQTEKSISESSMLHRFKHLEKVAFFNDTFVFESDCKKIEHSRKTVNNLVAKNNNHEAKTFRDRKNDYTRKQKHKKPTRE